MAPTFQTENDDQPKESLATHSLMAQAVLKEEEMNDACVPGTFGGNALA